MVAQTRYVVFKDHEHGPNTVSVSRHAPDLDTDHDLYKVEVDVQPGMSNLQVKVAAMQAASPIRQEALALKYSQLPPGTHTPPKSVSRKKEEDGGFVFEPDEIMSFVQEMLGLMVVVAQRAVRLELQGNGTASTDCLSVVNFNPNPFLEGYIEAGQGRGLHEAGHIRFDRLPTQYDRWFSSKENKRLDNAVGTALLGHAKKEGGALLANLLNLIMDRRADDLNALMHPGFALQIRRRMGHLMPGDKKANGCSSECDERLYIDFAYACKKRTHPRHAVVGKCIRIVNRAIVRVNLATHPELFESGKLKARKRLTSRPYEHLLTAARRVQELLDSELSDEESKEQAEIKKEHDDFAKFMKFLKQAINGQRSSSKMQKAFRDAMQRVHARNRSRSLAQVPALLQRIGNVGNPSSRMSGSGKLLDVVDIPLDHEAYNSALAPVKGMVRALQRVIDELSVPTHVELKGQEEGEFDEDEIHVFVAGGTDCMKITLESEELDLAVSFLLDVSGSMFGDGLAKQLGVALNESLIPYQHSVDSWFHAFSDKLYRCGSARRGNGIASVQCGGGTLEAQALREAAKPLLESTRRRKILICGCDGMPSDPAAVQEVCEWLMSSGILPMRALVGVDIAPQTYPIELFFNNWGDFLKNLVQTLKPIFSAARS